MDESILNVAFNGLTTGATLNPARAPMFWDMRVRSLETQALKPIKAADEMRGTRSSEDGAVAAAIARLQGISEYRRLFARAFGGARPINEQNLGRALAAFQRTLIAGNAPFDRYMRGDTAAMTPEQIRGMERFQSIGCINCHSGPMFSDFTGHVLGVPDNTKLVQSDAGADGTYQFRTPSLRNLSATGPYMHNGVFATLPQVINFYQRISGGGRGGNRAGRRIDIINPQVGRDRIDVLARQLNIRGRGQRDLLGARGPKMSWSSKMISNCSPHPISHSSNMTACIVLWNVQKYGSFIGFFTRLNHTCSCACRSNVENTTNATCSLMIAASARSFSSRWRSAMRKNCPDRAAASRILKYSMRGSARKHTAH